MKLLKNIIIVFIVIFISAQFFRPQKNIGALGTMEYFYADTKPTEEVKQILKISCIDCHSDVTHYKWHHNITPINFWVNNQIQNGKKHFNMSKWEGGSIKYKDRTFKELIAIFNKNHFSSETNNCCHYKTNLTEAEITTLMEWAKRVQLKYSLEPLPQ